jgi:hypothetical protein
MSKDETIDLPEGFGTTNYSESKFQTWKLPKADGSLLLRPLPPMKSMQGRPGIGLYWKTHFGWKGRDQRDPSKTRFRPFLCLEEKGRGGMIAQSCPACDLRKKRQDKIALLRVKGKELGKTEAQIRNAIAPHDKWLRDHGLDGKVRIPCIDKTGQVGIFLAPYGIFKDFRDKCRQLQQKGHDPAGPKGMFFEFIRTGQASPTSDSCEPHRITKEVNGESVEVYDFHVLKRDQAMAALENIPDLVEMMEKSRITLQQMEKLCELSEDSNGSYDPDAVDEILGVEKQPAPKAKAATVADEAPPVETKTKAAAKSAPAPAKETPKAPPASTDDPEDFDNLFGT